MGGGGKGMGGTIMTDMHDSLLKGGDSVDIMPLKGGGGAMVIAQVVSTPPGKGKTKRNKVFSSQRLYMAKVVEVMPEQIPWVGGGPDPIEVNEVPIPSDAKVTFSSETLDAMVKTEYGTLADAYVKDRLAMWQRYNTSNSGGKARIITTDSCSIPSSGAVDNIGVAGFDRLSYILPASTKKIVLIAAVKGDLEKLLHLLTYVEKHTHEPNTVIIFTSPFFDILKDNKRLFTAYLKVKSLAKATMIILCQNTIPNRIIGCKMGKKAVITMLEPTYVVYPFQKSIGGDNVSGIVFSGAAVNEVDVPDTTGKSASTSSFIAVPDKRGTVAFPPDIANNDEGMKDYKVYRFTGDRAYVMNTEIVEFILQKDVPVPKEDPFIKGKFVASDDSELMLNDVEIEKVPLDGEIYSIRKPGLIPVGKDWIDLKFTVDEAAMLNALNIRPDMLEEIFAGDSIPWRQQLANFMENMVTSKCFLEPTLIMDANCDTSTTFINRVFEYFLENDTAFTILKNEQDSILLEQGRIAVTDWKVKTEKEKALQTEKMNKLSGQLKDQEARSKIMGVDAGRTIDELLRNPFDDRRIKAVAFGTFRPYVTYVNKNKQWSREIMAVDLKNNEYSKAEISIPDGKDTERAMAKLLVAFQELQVDYPGWKFIW